MKDAATHTPTPAPGTPAPQAAPAALSHRERDLGRLIREIDTLRGDLRALADTPHLDELLKLIPRPGWTTPAEFELVSAGVRQLNAHVHLLRDAQERLLRGARLVGHT
ncbi:hypothetical protein GCM10008959_08330 [Deinococcus seoulensis]|uniref:Uncharacterized protein n=1 Tax=Deinococcus seoulensis TaxID=1837379 RepID=A0ABQ2RS10_9DEIO|nr:hypothetical protein [Deinococcus seoulensis]GGR49413.1 hypothetical protein GCM10008959_08330 [Deinococcus seoulensis]